MSSTTLRITRDLAIGARQMVAAKHPWAVSAALDIQPDNAALWYMRGRLALSRREPDVAESHLRRAESLGFPRDRLLPPLAEACYLRGDYAGARAALAQFSSRSPLPLLRPLLRYWTS